MRKTHEPRRHSRRRNPIRSLIEAATTIPTGAIAWAGGKFCTPVRVARRVKGRA